MSVNNPIVVPLEVSGSQPSSYNSLSNKPSINGVTLEGNKAGEDLNLVDVSEMGSLGDLYTEDKSSIVNAINELQNDVSDAIQRCGNPVDLNTQAKSDLVDAVNEVNAKKYELQDSGIPWGDISDHAKGKIDENKVFIIEYGDQYQSITHEIGQALYDGKAVYCHLPENALTSGNPELYLPFIYQNESDESAEFGLIYVDYLTDELMVAYAHIDSDDWDEIGIYQLHSNQIKWDGGKLGQQTKPATVTAAIELLYSMITALQ